MMQFFFRPSSNGLPKKDRITDLEVMTYGFLWGICILAQFTVVTTTWRIYTIVFSLTKEYLEKEAERAQLSIMLYDFANELFYWTIGVILIVGLVKCFIINWYYDGKNFFRRLIRLSLPINIRLSLLSLIIYAMPLVLAGLYFSKKLLQLVDTSSQPYWGLNPFKLAMRGIDKVNIFKHIVLKLQTLEEAKRLYCLIDDASAFFYLFALGLSIIMTITFFLQLGAAFATNTKK